MSKGRKTVVKQHAEFVEPQTPQCFGHGKCRHTGSVGGGEAKEMLLCVFVRVLSKPSIILRACILNLDKCIHSGFPFPIKGSVFKIRLHCYGNNLSQSFELPGISWHFIECTHIFFSYPFPQGWTSKLFSIPSSHSLQ